ncbi:MAG TPA: sugar ABC transporter permease [Acidimicrobiia bacterium]|nr:sugar ABC transporter permease [Acidimicrobiia bacterium]
MTATPPVVTEEKPPEQRPIHEEGARDNSLQVWLLRVLSALIVPVILVGFFFAFEFLQREDINKVIQVVVAVIVGVAGVWALYWAMDRLTNAFPARVGASVRPFVFAGPAMVLLAFYLIYPAVNTFILSFQNSAGNEFVGFDNYTRIFTESIYLIAIRNSVAWVIIVPAIAVVVGLTFATLADKLPRKSEAFSKSLVFLPMAISFVGASVVWTFIYSFRPEGFGEQIGLLNAIWVAFGAEPVNWLQLPLWNNLLLMVILIWLQTGFAMVILSSAIKSVPDDLLEAARIDGANEWAVFRKIVIPSIMSTIIVVWTTILITTWKVFDIVFVMTGGGFDTSVVAERMVTEFFTFFNQGMGAALAVILFIAVVPILVLNIKQFREQEATR